MSAFDFLICGGLTAVGLVLSWVRYRRKGPRAGVRLAAFSLLPLAAYLTGTVTLITRISSAVAGFASSFVFSPERYAGIVLAGVAAGLLLISGGIPLTGRNKRKKARAAKAGGRPRPVPWPRASGRSSARHRRRLRNGASAADPIRPTMTSPMSRRSCAAAASSKPARLASAPGPQAFCRTNTRPASHRQTAASPIDTAMPSTMMAFRYWPA